MPDDDSPPRSLKQDEDHEYLQPRATLTRSRTVSNQEYTLRLSIDHNIVNPF